MELKEYSVRELNEEDLAECAEIFSRTFSVAPWNEEWNVSDALLRLNHIHKSMDCIAVVASNSSGGIVGFITGNAEPFTHFRLYYLKEMCVVKSAQRNGIGSHMMKFLECLLIARGVKEIFLATNHSSPASGFYVKQGYGLVSDMRFYNKSVSS